MKPFKVSVIVPVYNVENYLEDCLESLVSQTLDGVEIVAVNDGSTDGSLAILERFRLKYPEKLFIYTTENRGVSHARNLGFAKAQGEYVWFVDSDDFVERDACERLYRKAVSDGNDLVLFRYYKVNDATGERTPFPVTHYSQNFTISQKPCELPVISPYPWIKFIKRRLFEGLAFPEGIRFEDLPVAYLLAVKASSIGVVNECLYNYRKNIGFLGSLTPATLDVKKAVIYLNDRMDDMGLREKYRDELDFIAVRHFFYRFWKMLTNYEKGKKELKLRIINELFDHMESEIPDWRENHYVKYFLPAHLYRMLYLYGSREEMLRFAEACDGMDEEAQKAWLKKYKCAHETEKASGVSYMQEREKEAAQAYKSAAKTGKTDKEQVFLESRNGLGLDSGVKALLRHLAETRKDLHLVLGMEKGVRAEGMEALSGITVAEAGTTEYGKALARSGCVVSDSPLPYYTEKIPGQFFMLLCGNSLYPLTEADCRRSKADIGLWQHSMLLADILYFPHEIIRENYMKSCMMEEVCPALCVIGEPPEMSERENMGMTGKWSAEKKTGAAELHPDGIPEEIAGKPSDFAGKPEITGYCRKILLCPQLLGKNEAERTQAYRSFASALYQLDVELGEDQLAYVCLPEENDLDFGDFRHIHPMPAGCELYDFAADGDAFVSDSHPGLLNLGGRGMKVIRYLWGEKSQKENRSLEERLAEYGVPCCGNVPELAEMLLGSAGTECGAPCCGDVPELAEKLRDSAKAECESRIPTWTAKETSEECAKPQPESLTAQKILDDVLEKGEMESDRNLRHPVGQEADGDLCGNRPRVLYYSGRRLSNKLIGEINEQVLAHPEKDYWFAFNHFRNPDWEKYRPRLTPGCFYLPIKPDMEKGRAWKTAGALISRIGLSAVYPVGRILSLGKKEYARYLGEAGFDEVIITATDNMRTIATLLAAAPRAVCTLDTFSAEKYEKCRSYRHQIRFLRRLLDKVNVAKL